MTGAKGWWAAAQRRPRETLAILAAFVVVLGALVIVLNGGDDSTTELVTEDASTTSTSEATTTTDEPTTTSSSTTETTAVETTTTAAPVTAPPPPPTTSAPVVTQPPAPPPHPIVAIQPGGLVRMNPDGSNRVLIASGSFGEPVLSRDGQWIAATRGNTELITMRIDGSSVNVAPGSWRTPSFSPNGAELVAVRFLEGPTLQLVRMNRDLSNQRVLPPSSTYPLGSNQVAWSPNGTQLAVTNNSSEALGLYDLATRAATVIRPRPPSVGYPRFSPDGSKIVFTSGGKVVVIAAGGGADVPIAQGDGPAAWHPNGRIYFSSGATLYAVNPDGSGLTPIAEGVSQPAA